MVAPRIDATDFGEDLLARLTTAAYSEALRHGLKGPFIDAELALWRALRGVLAEELSPLTAPDRARARGREEGALQ
jgi:hypothetical protein